MGMDMIYYEKEVREERCNQAKETINEISILLSKYYNKEPRNKLKNRIDSLEKENLQLRKELEEYKETINRLKGLIDE